MSIEPCSRRILLSVALALSLVSVSPARTAEPPGLRLERDVVPTAYEVELRLDPAADGFSGRVVADVELSAPTELVWLNAERLEIGRATVTAADTEQAARVLPGADHVVGLAVDEPLPSGAARIEIEFSGRYELSDSLGIFKQIEGGEPYLFTQFETTYARRAFPSFDEPVFKTPWRLTLTVPERFDAVANTPIVETTPIGDGWIRHRFAETEPLPSYLVAFAVGDFDLVDAGRVGDTALRIIAVGGRGDEARYAAEITGELLRLFENRIGLPYPYAKLDSISIPQTVGFGAMENVGLVTYAARLILADESEETLDFRRSYAAVAAHELAHQWFGNLVTTAWWDDIWLNEAFATWLGREVMTDFRPEWEFGLGAVSSRSSAMEADVLASARRIREPVTEEADIWNAFDAITYRKGAAVIAMFENWMGEERFAEGIRRYLTEHAHEAATADDFLRALDAGEGEGSTEVARAFATFLDQPGVPLVNVELSCPDDAPPSLRLRQERLLPVGSTGERDLLWKIPVCVRWRTDRGDGRECTLLVERQGRLSLSDAGSCPDWVLANEGGSGYYRVRYGESELTDLIDHADQLDLVERVTLIDDVAALALAGELPMDRALDDIAPFAGAESRHLVEVTLELVEAIDPSLVPDDRRTDFERLVRDLFGPRAGRLGIRPGADEDDDAELLRPRLLNIVGEEGGDGELRARARDLARTWLDDRDAIAPEVTATTLSLAALDGDGELFDAFRAEAAGADSRRDRRRLLAALGAFRDPELHRRALQLVLSEDFDPREADAALHAGLDTVAGRARVWTFVRENWNELTARLPTLSVAELPRLAADFCDASRAEEVREFFEDRLDDYPPGIKELEKAVEKIRLCAALVEVQRPSVARYLDRRSRPAAAARSTPAVAAAPVAARRR